MMIQILQLFVREFFDQNPLSHLSIMMLRNGRAERLTELSGSPVRPSPGTPLSDSAFFLACVSSSLTSDWHRICVLISSRLCSEAASAANC